MVIRPLAMFTLCALLYSCAAMDETAAREMETQTIPVYMIGSDLESGGGLATADISEMLRARPDAQRVNVVVMTGGSQKWMTPRIPSTGIGVYHIEGRNPKLIRHIESVSMGEAATLSGFLDCVVEAFPVDSYGLILWDHAGGRWWALGWTRCTKTTR